MDGKALLFFQQDMEALPLYEQLESLILDRIPDVQIKVQKSQISFYNRHMFACVSFAKVRKAKERPDHYIVVTFGLDHRLDSPRIDVAILMHKTNHPHTRHYQASVWDVDPLEVTGGSPVQGKTVWNGGRTVTGSRYQL